MKNKRVSQSQIAEAFAENIETTPARAGAMIDILFNLIYEYSKLGYDVQFSGFGTFTHTSRAPREGVSPQTGERITIPAVKVPKFKAGDKFKRVVNGKE